MEEKALFINEINPLLHYLPAGDIQQEGRGGYSIHMPKH
jgi:hypothetical protein